MEEYDKFQESQAKMAIRQEEWIKQVQEFEKSSQSILAGTQNEYENKLKAKATEITRVYTRLNNLVVARG